MLQYLRPTITTLVFTATPAMALDGAAAFNAAINRYFEVMDEMSKEAPRVDDAVGFARLMNAWTAANDGLTTAAAAFAAKNPEAMKAKENPPELAAALGRLGTMQQKYGKLGQSLGQLNQKFGKEPVVTVAMTKFQNSLTALQQIGKPSS